MFPTRVFAQRVFPRRVFPKAGASGSGGGASSTISVDAATDAWQDTGLTLSPGYPLLVTATGTAERSPSIAVTATGGELGGGAVPANFPVHLDTVTSYALAILLWPAGQAPPLPPVLGGSQLTSRVLSPGTERTFSPSEVLAAAAAAGPWRLWARMNDDQSGDNDGFWSVTVVQGVAVAPPVLDSATPFLLLNVPSHEVDGH